MDTVIRCPRCNKRYVFFGSIKEVSYCPECLLLDQAEYKLVREYVRDNKGCSINEVSEATKVSTKRIITYLKEERLETIGENKFLTCEACGTPINTGRFCQPCSKRGNISVTKSADENHPGKWHMEFKQK